MFRLDGDLQSSLAADAADDSWSVLQSAARLVARGIETHVPQQQQDVHGGVPPAVPRRAAPPPVAPLKGEQPRARALEASALRSPNNPRSLAARARK
jgi:hypothetical protein